MFLFNIYRLKESWVDKNVQENRKNTQKQRGE